MAQTQQCSLRDRLMQAYTDALLAYSNIAQTYSQAQWKAGFSEVLKHGERARIDSEVARMALARHISAHECRDDS
jgi:hypothetical protein